MAVSLHIAKLSGETADVSVDPGTALLDVRKTAEEYLKTLIAKLVDKDGNVLDESKTVREADVSDGDTLQAVVGYPEAELEAIVEKIKADHNPEYEFWRIPTRKGEWLIVETADNHDSDFDYYNNKLYHLPTWTPGSKPLLKGCYKEHGGMGVRPIGKKLAFGKEGFVVELDAGHDNELQTIELASLLK
mmetsp:Transcript_60174/g.112417  ORF Transcript_60174/g.112417 Transcript_60174/m.112417 type:complete len:189 (-) Transcript_60174:103-669(-)